MTPTEVLEGQTLALRTPDGCTLAARTWYPAQAQPRGGVLLAPAMGVPQRHYAPFARWLAGQGWRVLGFDYRGMGESRPAEFQHSLRGFEADVLTWARQDAATALDTLAASLPPGSPLYWVGHSLGGQIAGLVPGRERLAGVVTVASGSGYWRRNAWKLRRMVWLLWFGIAPVSVALAGYFPGRRLGMVGDLPAGVMRQWRRWCLHPDYLMGEGGPALRAHYAAWQVPLLALSFTDDEFMSEHNIRSLHGFYASARSRHQRLGPADVSGRRIGHFGFFRETFAPTLWPRVGAWLAHPHPHPDDEETAP